MREPHRLIVLSAVAVILVGGVGVCVMVNPLAAAGLTGAMFAVAAIIRAIAGSPAKSETLTQIDPPITQIEATPSEQIDPPTSA